MWKILTSACILNAWLVPASQGIFSWAGKYLMEKLGSEYESYRQFEIELDSNVKELEAQEWFYDRNQLIEVVGKKLASLGVSGVVYIMDGTKNSGKTTIFKQAISRINSNFRRYTGPNTQLTSLKGYIFETETHPLSIMEEDFDVLMKVLEKVKPSKHEKAFVVIGMFVQGYDGCLMSDTDVQYKCAMNRFSEKIIQEK